MDVDTGKPPVNTFNQVIDYASRAFQNMNLYYQAKTGNGFFFPSVVDQSKAAPDPATPNKEPKQDWGNIVLVAETVNSPFLLVKLEESPFVPPNGAQPNQKAKVQVTVDGVFVECKDHSEVRCVVILYKEHFYYAYPPAVASHWKGLLHWKTDDLKAEVAKSLKEALYEVSTKPLPGWMIGGKKPNVLQTAVAQAGVNLPNAVQATIN